MAAMHSNEMKSMTCQFVKEDFLNIENCLHV